LDATDFGASTTANRRKLSIKRFLAPFDVHSVVRGGWCRYGLRNLGALATVPMGGDVENPGRLLRVVKEAGPQLDPTRSEI
jgi:hypothetical protein